MTKSICPLFLILSLCSLSMLTACGGSAETHVADGESFLEFANEDKIPMPSPERLQAFRQAAELGVLSCADVANCPSALALVSIVSASGITRCSGFLISANEVLTNDHCIEKSIELRGLDRSRNALPCSESVFVHFAKGGGQLAETAQCSKIERHSLFNGVASLDYAVIKLNEPQRVRAPLKIASEGLGDREETSIFRVQMTNDSSTGALSGVLSQETCHASHATYLFPEISSTHSPLMTFGDCAIQSGNSGSPVLNSRGEVSAILQGMIFPSTEDLKRNELQGELLDSSYGQVAVATQLFCLPGFSRGESCLPLPRFYGYPAREYLKRNEHRTDPALPTAPSAQHWTLLSETRGSKKIRTYFSVPDCASGNSFDSFRFVYRLGINRSMQAEWRRVDFAEQPVVGFVRKDAHARLFVTQSGAEISLPACSL